ncbi:hypothetical protein IO89_15100 [Epilithonimonas lactis]|uniref:Rieske domain-containing protein n=1 Tax=Epilithonimonas lactis TaxID=421072 RepID=A0A085BGA5_9FLAO|nr:hypothetical protein IO89_15100 [Epilithonimonas lactis]
MKFSIEKLKETNAGTGRIVKFEGKTNAAYFDQKAAVHLSFTICPDTGGTLKWNPSEVSRDCPRHGSPFDNNGKLLNGPALTGPTSLADNRE